MDIRSDNRIWTRLLSAGTDGLFYLLFYLLHGLYRTLSHSQSEESQVYE